MYNAKPTGKFELTPLYDKLESHLRALNTLAVTPEQISEFVFPMVESSLLEEILIAWQRSPYYQMDETIPILKGKSTKTELDFLMEFLSNEAESEIQRKIVRAGFESTQKTVESQASKQKPYKTKLMTDTTPVSAAGLCVKQQKACVFCSYPHNTVDCRKFGKYTHEEKLEKLSKAKTCFKCLTPHHRANDCRNTVECSQCHEDTHVKQMCKRLAKENKTKPVTESVKNKTVTDTVTALNTDSCQAEVFLKTVLVRITGQKGSQSFV